MHEAFEVRVVSGAEIEEADIERMACFYRSTCRRYGAWDYLNEGMWDWLARHGTEHVVLFLAEQEGATVAGSFCIRGQDTLWGRYWGSQEEIDCLHFEVCYYAPIQWAIEQRLDCFDPGAGGSHKRRRGFVARPHASLHRWYEPQMDGLIRAWLAKVNGLMLEEIEAINAELPFKADAPELSL